jgi:hypothetical protein
VKRKALAAELRVRVVEKGHADPRVAARTSDTQIIESYITCSGCGAREVNDFELYRAISQADSAEGFFSILDAMGTGREETASTERPLDASRRGIEAIGDAGASPGGAHRIH